MPVQSKVVVIGASAGGPFALKRLLKRLPPDFPAVILVVVHIGSHYSILPKILQKDCAIPVRHAQDGQPMVPGVVLIAPPDHHLLIEDGTTRLSKGAKENFARPAIDPLFRSAAVFYRENSIGVILSGLMDDGTIGLQAIKAYGGLALVQDPEDADEPSMPKSALQHVKVDACLSIEALADRLTALAWEENSAQPPRPSPIWDSIETQGQFDLSQKIEIEDLARIATPSEFTCPECHGSLWTLKGTDPPHFRCHTGHSFSIQGLSDAQQNKIEEAIWVAIRALHEKQMLMSRFAKTAEKSNRKDVADEHIRTASELARHADILRKMIAQRDGDKA